MKRIQKLTIIVLIITSCQNSVNKNLEEKDEQNSTDTSSVVNENVNPKWSESIFNVEPIDESITDKSLIKFISNLKSTIKKKDTTELFKMIDDSIVVSYGGGLYGKNEFRIEWGLNEPNNSKIWSTMNFLLKYGGAWDHDDEFGKHFVIPYYQSDNILGKIDYDFDWYRTAICNNSNVKVFKNESPNSVVIDSLNYSLVELISNSPKRTFEKIKILDKNLIGYVYSSQLNYLSDCTIVLVKKDAKWKIVSFAPYD